MIYSIASMKDTHSEYDWEIFFDKSGNKYIIGCRFLNEEKDNHEYRHKDFEYKDDAEKFFMEQASLIINSVKSKKQRLEYFQ